MNDSKALRVLWVDDDPDMMLKKVFEQQNLRVTIAKDDVTGIRELNEHKMEWDFVLLDGRGTDPTKAGDKVTGTKKMLRELYALKKSERDIPHCVYTAFIKEENVKDLREEEEGLVILSKGKTKSIKVIPPIVGYIKKQASLIYERQVTNLYHDVFNAIGTIGLDQEHQDTIMGFLKALSFEKFRDECPSGNELRQVIEATCKVLMNKGLLPTACLKPAKNRRPTSEVNITDAVGYLGSGKTTFILGKRTTFGIIDTNGPILCSFLAECVLKALNYTQKDSHDNTPLDIQDETEILDINKHITEYHESVEAPLYIYSSVLIVCDFLKSIAKTIANNPDKETNKARAYNLQNDVSIQNDKDGNEVGIASLEEDENGNFHCGPHIYVTPKKVRGGYLVPLSSGTKISISAISNNTSSNGYRYFAKEYYILH